MLSQFPQPCTLLNIPEELRLQVITFLDDRRDLYSFAQTCRAIEDTVMQRLYHSFEFEVSQQPLLSLRDPVPQSVRDLKIKNGRKERRQSMHKRRRLSVVGSVAGHTAGLLRRIPDNQLKELKYFHQTPIDGQVIALLLEHHRESLRHFHFHDVADLDEQTEFPKDLQSLEAHTVNGGEAVERMIAVNSKTLRRLLLGQEKHLLQQYHLSRIGFLDHLPTPVEEFYTSAYSLESFPQLRELSLVGLDLDLLRPTSIGSALFFCQLEKLTLESCPNGDNLLESVADIFHWTPTPDDATPQVPRKTPELKHFLFRHEHFTPNLKDALVRFLSSFTGLETLSLLLENASVLERPSMFIAAHGPTLKTLVLESRIQPREHLLLDTSRPFGGGGGYSHDLWSSNINEICQLCPALESLGIGGFPWTDESVRLHRTLLPTLRNLRTMHVRNFPENSTFSQVGDYSIKEYASKFMEWVFPPASMNGAESPPTLLHLAIGPTLYETRWNIVPQPPSPNPITQQPASTAGPPLQEAVTQFYTNNFIARSPPARAKTQAIHPYRAQAPEFLRTHHFWLDWAKTRFGKWSPLITPVSERFMREMESGGTRELGGAFEQVWLR